LDLSDKPELFTVDWLADGPEGETSGENSQELEMLDRNEMVLRDERYAPQAMAPYMPQPMLPYMPPPEPEEPSLLASIFRHFWIVVIVLAAFLALAFVFLKKTTPLYESYCNILIETNIPVINANDPQVMAVGGGNYLKTQTTLMRSSLILTAVLSRPEIATLSVFKGVASPFTYLRDNLQADLGKSDDSIRLSISTPQPKDSAAIVNAVYDAYNAYLDTSKVEHFGAVVNMLKPRQLALQNEIADDETRLEQIRHDNPNIFSFDADGQSNSPAIVNLNLATQHYTELRLRVDDARITYGSGNPQLQTLQKEEKSAYEEYKDALSRAMQVNQVQAEYTKYKSDLNQAREYLKPLSDRIEQVDRQQDMMKNIHSITVMDPPVARTSPSYPVPVQILALATVLGLIVGGFLAYLRDKTDTRLRTAEEIQNIVGLQILGVVPRMPGRRTSVARAMAVHLDPRSEVAEAYRTIRTAVYFGPAGNRARTLLVTSPEAGDGKTTSASNLAIAIAQTGRSVLLLDADFRKPTQHKNMDVKDSVGLSSVLSGTETLDRAIQRTGVDGLDILPCGAIPGNPSEILNSQEFGELVDRLALKYDHIIFDSPPVNLVTDARILGAVCDATVLVLRAEKSTRKAAEHARNALLSVGAKLIGAVVNGASRGKGYETYGGSYYGTPSSRGRNEMLPTPVTTPMRPAVGPYLPRAARSDDDVAEG
jgi:capsular exopolysaccharide synthesis family protein